MHSAAKEGKAETVKALIEAGADKEAKDVCELMRSSYLYRNLRNLGTVL